MPVPPPMRRRDLVLAIVPLAVMAAIVGGIVIENARLPPTALSQDWYQYYYPTISATLAALRDGGRGLLWNTWQNSGEPFFGVSTTGLLAPINVLAFVFPVQQMLQAAIPAFLLVSLFSAYVLGLSFGVPRAAALAGAVAFTFSNATLGALYWGPNMIGPWVWVPAALAGCESLLRTPSWRAAVGLAIVLALSLLTGFPQLVVFGYQVIALRIAWEALFRPKEVLRSLPALVVGLTLPAGLTAIHLVPSLQTALESVRNLQVPTGELAAGRFITSLELLRGIHGRHLYFNAVLAVPAVTAAAAFASPERRRQAFFYLGVSLLFVALAFGPATPLYGIYRLLPLGGAFRGPDRFLFIANLGMAALVALGIGSLGPSGRGRAFAAAALALATGLVLSGPVGLVPLPREWALGALIVVAFAAAGVATRLAGAARLIVCAAVIADLLLGQRGGIIRLPASDDFLFTHAPLLSELRARMTAQDRIYLAGNAYRRDDPFSGFRLFPKMAMLFRLRSIHDYEPQPDLRYTDLFTRMREGRPLRDLVDVYYPRAWLMPSLDRPLLDLLATRYLVVLDQIDTIPTLFDPPLPAVLEDEDARVYENPQALPRAYWVPRLEVLPTADDLLARLADPEHDPRATVLVDEPPASSFRGEPGGPTSGAAVEFARDDPEVVRLTVKSPARGWVVLTDVDSPGWTAQVDDQPSPILRANYVFRAVEVPAGQTTVTFRYRPRAVLAGTFITAATLAGLVLAWWRRRPAATTSGGSDKS